MASFLLTFKKVLHSKERHMERQYLKKGTLLPQFAFLTILSQSLRSQNIRQK